MNDYDSCDYQDDPADNLENWYEDEVFEDYPDEREYLISRFADPGGESALWPATKDNPRIFPCPTCKQPDRLTRKDVRSHYQCNECADRAEGKIP